MAITERVPVAHHAKAANNVENIVPKRVYADLTVSDVINMADAELKSAC